jgi:hypothetical protein
MLPPTPFRLVPGLLRARGVALSERRLRNALTSGVIPGTYDQGRWTMTAEDVAAAELYFRKDAAPERWRGGAAGLEQAKARSR